MSRAFVLARRHLGVVDNWADQVKHAAMLGTGEFERQVLRRDGELLMEAFKRQADRDDKKGPRGRSAPSSPPRSWAYG